MIRSARIDGAAVCAAIEAAERRTAAELVVSVAPFFLGRVGKAARRAFARLGVAATRARTGVLIFVVPARRQVFVLPDAGAEAALPAGVIDEAARVIAAGFARRDGTAGLCAGIDVLADALAAVLPPGADEPDELPALDARLGVTPG